MNTSETTSPIERPFCSSCRRRPAAYVLDQLGKLGRALSSEPSVAFPVWACENCVQELLGEVLDAVSLASVCRVEAYQQARASL
jgi:hypothetical protein